MNNTRDIAIRKISKSEECNYCKYDYHPNYRLCIGKYKNVDHSCYVPRESGINNEEPNHE